MLRGPMNRKDPLYDSARFMSSIEEQDHLSTSFQALHIVNVSLPCAAYRVNLLNHHVGWSLLDSRVMCMIAMASMVVCAQKALVKLENTRGFATSPVCQLMRALVHASGGHSVLWIGTAADQELPVNGARTHLLMGNAESKHLLIKIELALKSGTAVKRVLLSEVLGRAGHVKPVCAELDVIFDKVFHGGSRDGPRRVGRLIRNGTHVAVVHGSCLPTDVAA